MEPFEYAIKKDIRNNPIVREIDEARHREMWRSVAVGALLGLLGLGSAWQHFELIRYGYLIERMQQERAAEEEAGRRLRLEIQALGAPQRIEALAKGELRLVHATREDTVVLERVTPTERPDRAVVARR